MCRLLILSCVFLCSFNSFAEKCKQVNLSTYIENTVYSSSDSEMYSEIPHLMDISIKDTLAVIENKLQKKHPSLWSVLINCKNEDVIFFQLLVSGEHFPQFDGFFKLKNNKHFSGPHSLLSKDTVIIMGE
jgi:hypothetical protein